GAAGVEVALKGGRVLEATIAGADPDVGVVALQLAPDRAPLPPPLSFAGSPPAAGDAAIAVSAAQGAGSSVEVGTVSAVGLTVDVPDQAAPGGTSPVDGVLSTDTPQPPGSGGAPLVNAQGQVIGIMTGPRMQPTDQGQALAGQAFALDATAAQKLVSSLISSGTAPQRVGLVSRWLDPATAAVEGTQAGVQVLVVDPGSAAAAAGIQAGDVITAIDGGAAFSGQTTAFPSFSDYLESLASGALARLTVVRNGTSRQLTLTLPLS
ncbi:MAG: S1C family serine protease, partial [Candidatus Dormibacteria bacterium]